MHHELPAIHVAFSGQEILRALDKCAVPEESGEEAEVQLDAAEAIQLRWAMPDATPEQMNSVLAKLQTIGLNATVTLKPATVPEIRSMCDRICALAEQIAEHSDEEDALGFVLDALIALRKQMQPSQQ